MYVCAVVWRCGVVVGVLWRRVGRTENTIKNRYYSFQRRQDRLHRRLEEKRGMGFAMPGRVPVLPMGAGSLSPGGSARLPMDGSGFGGDVKPLTVGGAPMWSVGGMVPGPYATNDVAPPGYLPGGVPGPGSGPMVPMMYPASAGMAAGGSSSGSVGQAPPFQIAPGFQMPGGGYYMLPSAPGSGLTSPMAGMPPSGDARFVRAGTGGCRARAGVSPFGRGRRVAKWAVAGGGGIVGAPPPAACVSAALSLLSCACCCARVS